LLAYLDERVHYVWVNEAYRRWFNRSPESIRGRHAREIVGEAAWLAVRHHVARALAGEEVSYEARVDFGPGHRRDVKAAYVPDRDASGRVRGFVSLVTDISEANFAETEMRLAREQLQVVVDATPALIARYDRGLRIVWANKNYAARFGKQPEDVVGKPLPEIVGPAAFAVLEPGAARVLAGETIDLEMEVPYLTLGPRWMHFAVSPTFDAGGAVDGCVAVITDNTHLRKLEIERAHALAKLREADRRKDEFLAMLSHELRNPLAPLLTAVEILRLAPKDPETSATARAVIERQVAHMKRLLDDLLDVSRVSQGKIALRREVLDLGTVLQRAAEVSQPLMADRDQRLSVTSTSGAGAILVDADPARLVQVFGNLLNNAAKYSEPGGTIEVETAVEDREAVVRVRDRGVGMTPDLLERAFDLFVQDSRSLDRAQGGTGIGLTMVRSLIKLHGGSVRAFSDGPGHGCEIVVRLPRAQPGQGAGQGQPRPAPAPPSRSLRVLVVDDNVDAATTLAHLLTLLGHEVVVAHDGPGALARTSRTRPDLALIDIGLPGMDGYALATALRAAGLDRDALVAVTGYGRAEDVRRAKEHGFAHHLVKPVDLAALQRITALRNGD
jgi:PAS domain S-box-containing protein